MDAERAGRIQSLRSNAAFQELVEEFDAIDARYRTAVTQKLFVTGELYDNFEYKRGYLAGALDVLRYPDKAAKTLEREIAKSKSQEADVAGT